jgi:hypothetical protein
MNVDMNGVGVSIYHRYLEVDCSSFVMCPLQVLALQVYFAAATNSTNQTKQGRRYLSFISLFYNMTSMGFI